MEIQRSLNLKSHIRNALSQGALNLDGLAGSGAGANCLNRFKPYVDDGKTIVVSLHRVWDRRVTTWF